MVALTHSEAILFRILAGFFGPDSVIHNMSVRAVCGGELPAKFNHVNGALSKWAGDYKCLFTVLDPSGDPKLVVEFVSGFGDVIDMRQVEYKHLLEPMLNNQGVRYVSVSQDDFSALTDPDTGVDFPTFMANKLGMQVELGFEAPE